MKTSVESRVIYITQADLERLQQLIVARAKSGDDFSDLQAELARGQVVSPSDIPPDVITMNSRARLRDLDTGEEMVYTLSFPEQASIDDDRISVLAPIGTAMLGQRVGSEFSWNVPAGSVRLRVEEVLYQPEAAGAYHL